MSTTEKKRSSTKTATKKETSTNKTVIDKDGSFCVYLGPTIVGKIQSGSIYKGSKNDVVNQLSAVIERHPLIASLIIENSRLVEDRVKIKTPGSYLYVNYHKLLKGIN